MDDVRTTEVVKAGHGRASRSLPPSLLVCLFLAAQSGKSHLLKRRAWGVTGRDVGLARETSAPGNFVAGDWEGGTKGRRRRLLPIRCRVEREPADGAWVLVGEVPCRVTLLGMVGRGPEGVSGVARTSKGGRRKGMRKER